MEILEAQHDLEVVRAMLGHVRLQTTQIYAQIRPAQLKSVFVLVSAANCHPVRDRVRNRRSSSDCARGEGRAVGSRVGAVGMWSKILMDACDRIPLGVSV